MEVIGAEHSPELLDVLALAKRFELPAMAQACGRKLAFLAPKLEPDSLLKVLRAAKVHALRRLQEACFDSISAIGKGFLLQDEVCDILGEIISTERNFYKEIVTAAHKKRRTA